MQKINQYSITKNKCVLLKYCLREINPNKHWKTNTVTKTNLSINEHQIWKVNTNKIQTNLDGMCRLCPWMYTLEPIKGLLLEEKTYLISTEISGHFLKLVSLDLRNKCV